MQMRIMTNKEWDRLVDLTGGDNSKMHWGNMFSLVKDTENEFGLGAYRAFRGYYSACRWDDASASHRSAHLGFRPVVDILSSDSQFSEVKEGQSVIMGTLYMDGKPVRVPENPTCYGDIADYVPGAILEMGAPISDPAYQVIGIRVGNALIADRNMLKDISYNDIEKGVNPTYSPVKNGAVVAVRLFFGPNHIAPMAELVFAFGGTSTIEWANETQRKEYEPGINAYTVFFDERFPTRTFESFKKE